MQDEDLDCKSLEEILRDVKGFLIKNRVPIWRTCIFPWWADPHKICFVYMVPRPSTRRRQSSEEDEYYYWELAGPRYYLDFHGSNIPPDEILQYLRENICNGSKGTYLTREMMEKFHSEDHAKG